MLFSVIVGTGVQVCSMAAVTMVIALLGLLSPANRGSLLTTLLLLFVFMGSFAGYYASRTYKMFQGKDWKLNTLLTALFYPGCLFGLFFVLNLFLWAEASSQAIPFGTFFALVILWFGISVPLVFLGSYYLTCHNDAIIVRRVFFLIVFLTIMHVGDKVNDGVDKPKK